MDRRLLTRKRMDERFAETCQKLADRVDYIFNSEQETRTWGFAIILYPLKDDLKAGNVNILTNDPEPERVGKALRLVGEDIRLTSVLGPGGTA